MFPRAVTKRDRESGYFASRAIRSKDWSGGGLMVDGGGPPREREILEVLRDISEEQD
jgi:hypothetical protein